MLKGKSQKEMSRKRKLKTGKKKCSFAGVAEVRNAEAYTLV